MHICSGEDMGECDEKTCRLITAGLFTTLIVWFLTALAVMIIGAQVNKTLQSFTDNLQNMLYL